MRAGDRGFALIVVLLAIAAVFALAAHGAATMRAALVESRVLAERAEAERDARAAAAMVIVGLGIESSGTGVGGSDSGPSGGGSDEPVQPKFELPEFLKVILGDRAKDFEADGREAVEGSVPVADGGGVTGRAGSSSDAVGGWMRRLPPEPLRVRPRERSAEYMVSVGDASSLVSVNTASRAQLERFFQASGVPADRGSALAAQIVDWRDADDFVEQNGAEASVYVGRGVRPRNGPFGLLEELLYLPAMDAGLFARLRGGLTVAASDRVYVGSASRETLLSLPGMTAEAADGLIELRRRQLLTKEVLERLLPVSARELREVITLTPSSVLRVRVERLGETRMIFEGLAVVDSNGIRAIGLRPILDGAAID